MKGLIQGHTALEAEPGSNLVYVQSSGDEYATVSALQLFQAMEIEEMGKNDPI